MGHNGSTQETHFSQKTFLHYLLDKDIHSNTGKANDDSRNLQPLYDLHAILTHTTAASARQIGQDGLD